MKDLLKSKRRGSSLRQPLDLGSLYSGVSATTLDRGSEINSLPNIPSESAGPPPPLYRLGTLEGPARIICKLTKIHREIRSIRRPCSFQATTNPGSTYRWLLRYSRKRFPAGPLWPRPVPLFSWWCNVCSCMHTCGYRLRCLIVSKTSEFTCCTSSFSC